MAMVNSHSTQPSDAMSSPVDSMASFELFQQALKYPVTHSDRHSVGDVFYDERSIPFPDSVSTTDFEHASFHGELQNSGVVRGIRPLSICRMMAGFRFKKLPERVAINDFPQGRGPDVLRSGFNFLNSLAFTEVKDRNDDLEVSWKFQFLSLPLTTVVPQSNTIQPVLVEIYTKPTAPFGCAQYSAQRRHLGQILTKYDTHVQSEMRHFEDDRR